MPPMKNVKSSGQFFSSAVTAICMFSPLCSSYGFDETLSKPCTLLCQKQWFPSALLLPFVLPSVCWFQQWLDLWARRVH